jgi:YggT family protein
MILALTRGDVADYVAALFIVYFVLIMLRILLSWVQMARPIPYNRPLRAVLDFITEVVDPYLNLFRRVIPALGPFDLSPIVATLVLFLVEGLVVGLIQG